MKLRIFTLIGLIAAVMLSGSLIVSAQPRLSFPLFNGADPGLSPSVPSSVSDAGNVVGMVPSAPQSIVGNWQIDCVDCPKDIASINEQSMQLDAAHHPHFAYGGDHLYYTWYDGTTWHYETVDEAPGVGVGASLVLDGSERPHVAYLSYAHDLKYAWYDGVGWEIEVVVPAGSGTSTEYITSLALDAAGHPHIVFKGPSTQYALFTLKHAWHDGTSWHIETVDDGTQRDAALVLDNAAHPHIAYYTATGDPTNYAWHVKYAWYDGLTWEFETVVNEIWVGEDLSLALDVNDQPHISYNGIGTLKYAWRSGSSWHVTSLDTVGYFGPNTSLRLDSADQPHISYGRYDASHSDLKYTWNDGAVWHTDTAVAEGGVTSLALDGTGQPYIGYFTGDLKYVWRDVGGWHTNTVDTTGSVGAHTSLALDTSGHPRVSYGGFSTQLLKYAQQNGANWQTELVSAGSTTQEGWYNSLKLDQANRPHISYYDSANSGVLRYAWYDSVVWHIETVDNAGYVGMYTSLALDAENHPHISYQAGFHGGASLNYAWQDGTTWHITAVDMATAKFVQHTSLALDKSGYPHISYLENSQHDLKYVYDLKYAWYDGTTWHIETVDNVGDMSTFTPLALDQLGQPHIAYISYPGGSSPYLLKYAWYDGVTWHIETVSGNVGGGEDGISLALDKFDRPRIAGGSSGGGLYYAQRDGGTWSIGTVSNGGDFSLYVSLALDSFGQPYISFYDETDDDIKCAHLLFPALVLDKQATPYDGLLANAILTYTLTISGPGLNVSLWDPLSSDVDYISGSITSTLVPLAVYSPTASAIFWQGELPTNTVSVIRFQVKPNVAITESVVSPPIVNTAWLTDTETGRSTSATVVVNGYHAYLPMMWQSLTH